MRREARNLYEIISSARTLPECETPVNRLPLLAQIGYRGPVFATPATIEMGALIISDSAKIQSQDTERQNRRLEREGKPPRKPLYGAAEAEQIISLMKGVPYLKPVPVAEGIQAALAESGHMLGSTSIKLTVDEGGRHKSVIFSGDLGPKGVPILRDFEPFQDADLVFWNRLMATAIIVLSPKPSRSLFARLKRQWPRAGRF